MSAAKELRDAAERLRTLAEAATPGPWEQATDPRFGPQAVVRSQWGDAPGTIRGFPKRARDYRGAADAEFIAAMHPGVALALADWLECEAKHVGFERLLGMTPADAEKASANALAVARLINGGEK